MAKTKRIIPFGILPASWGLKGKSRAIAEAEYYFEGEELERKLADIEYTNEKENRLAHNDIDLKYGRITENQHLRVDIEVSFDKDSDEYKRGILDLDYKENKITETEYEKQMANIDKKSWVKITNVDANGSIEFDWNDYFIEELEQAGYGPAPKQEMIVDQWFNELCKAITIENYQGDIGLLEEQAEERENNLVSVKRNDNGKTEIS